MWKKEQNRYKDTATTRKMTMTSKNKPLEKIEQADSLAAEV